ICETEKMEVGKDGRQPDTQCLFEPRSAPAISVGGEILEMTNDQNEKASHDGKELRLREARDEQHKRREDGQLQPLEESGGCEARVVNQTALRKRIGQLTHQ